jgi:hypothetical protein
VATEFGPKGANTGLIACRRVAVHTVHGTSNKADSRSDERQGRQGREGKAGKAGRQGGKAWQASKAPRLQPSESADCDPAQAARSLNNRPSLFPDLPSQTFPDSWLRGCENWCNLYTVLDRRRRFDREGTIPSKSYLPEVPGKELFGRPFVDLWIPSFQGSVEAQNAWQDQICGDTSRKST